MSALAPFDADGFEAMVREWERIVSLGAEADRQVVESWRAALAALSDEETRLRRSGQWVRGPSDLMSVLQLERDEVRNCRVFGWLLDPIAPHGLGTRFLDAVTAEIENEVGRGVWPDSERAVVALEEHRDGRRADVIVRAPEWTIVFEAKIDAPESPEQGRDLTDRWNEDGAYFVFLSRRGTRMRTEDPEVPWTPLSWARIRVLLEAALAQADQEAELLDPAGRGAAVQYLMSLKRTFG